MTDNDKGIRTPWQSYKSLKENENFRFKKSLGQNILVEPNVISRIVEASCPATGESALEIGPGTGALTASLLSAYEKVTVLELDTCMIEELTRDLGANPGLNIIHGDVLKADLSEFNFNKIIANLPYSISTRAISRIVDFRAAGKIPDCRAIWALVQEEVADRISARPEERDNGPLALKVQALGKVRKLFRVSPNCFRPRPKINSALLQVEFDETPRIDINTLTSVMEIINFIFTMRRKKLSTSLGAMLGRRGMKCSAAEVIEDAGLDPSVRPERLYLEHFMALLESLGRRGWANV
ncbi:MAG: ribosomal RNA small subunit methyltransferase A [Candidatus Wallbacteria bacterium HGW-Wallbacteria-1]|jgi:16S rRNA (adenine1518-N6/adenine1519-N6)-dimethyltransferase|uniref:Ribosomal RNA small subunit methyltransferase A n=1 Tax=Candidatus Wallbacteria bacterium HGW-Wallbacteria-1 TaxID=2013854 RepID=A0A2N1PSQ3_9BACT|nr:MAG: ribosomal RNA small subunit methyltransferase A [Candidatus Wallbacteria bacterium HGW-Wallbacteria-1]